MSQNADAVANQGEFAGHVKPSDPLMTGGHQPGKLVSEADRAPEFHAQTLPAGSAPKTDTYTPDPAINNQKTFTSASSTLVGADSGSVHTGLGHPGQGQTSSELHDKSRQSGGSGGLVGLKEHHSQGNFADLKDDPAHAKQRNLHRDEAGTRGNTGGPPAQEMEPESAAQVNTGR